jgi:hypothetical protein
MSNFNKPNENFFKPKRISIYIYDSQLKKIDEICKKRKKTKRIIFFEAIQNYIGLYKEKKI